MCVYQCSYEAKRCSKKTFIGSIKLLTLTCFLVMILLRKTEWIINGVNLVAYI